ncbi:MAG: hypothetical protein CVU09_11670 [Bacteroidetes bacterium HGW-Bacteroidetes-4]|jgi:hypothetical protein|nr:MAG: hypothetical protein CVU09_11670 [Bacteroidetes bacterium HGW-Bacteroidetes-4]
MMLFPATKVNNIHFNSRACFKTFFGLIMDAGFYFGLLRARLLIKINRIKNVKSASSDLL